MYWLSKRPLPLSSLRMAETMLDLAYRYWSGLRRDGLLPSRPAIDTPQFRFLLPNVDWLTDLSVAGHAGANLGRIEQIATARRRAGHSALDLRSLLLEDMRTVTFTGSPIYQELVVESRGSVDSWRHLLLPTAQNGVRVDAVLQVTSLRIEMPFRARRISA